MVAFNIQEALVWKEKIEQVIDQDNLSFALFCPDWNADEEILLLEVFSFWNISMFSSVVKLFLLLFLGLYILIFKWYVGTLVMDLDVVAEHVGTKSKSECIDHYCMFFCLCCSLIQSKLVFS